MDEAANRATSATASPPPVGEDWEEGEESSTSNAIEPAPKKRKTTTTSSSSSSSKKANRNSMNIEPSPPPGMTLPDLIAVASQLVSPVASSSKSTLQQQQSNFLPPLPLPSSITSSTSSSSKLASISSVSVPSAFSYEELIQFRNGFKSELIEMEDRMNSWMSKGKEWLGILDSAVESVTLQQQSQRQHQLHHQQQQQLLDTHENHGFNGSVIESPIAVTQGKKDGGKSRTEQDLEDYLHGLPVFDAVALPLRKKVEGGEGDKMNVDV